MRTFEGILVGDVAPLLRLDAGNWLVVAYGK
jgi:hypothetical protein